MRNLRETTAKLPQKDPLDTSLDWDLDAILADLTNPIPLPEWDVDVDAILADLTDWDVEICTQIVADWDIGDLDNWDIDLDALLAGWDNCNFNEWVDGPLFQF